MLPIPSLLLNEEKATRGLRAQWLGFQGRLGGGTEAGETSVSAMDGKCLGLRLLQSVFKERDLGSEIWCEGA